MAQHTKISYPTHNYHKSFGITDPVDQELKFNAIGIKKLLSTESVRLKISHFQVTAELLVSWSDYGDIWFTMDNYHDVDVVVSGFDFKHSFALFDNGNYILIIYSKVLDSYRVVMHGNKSVPGTLRASIYPNNGFFDLEEYCDFDDRISTTVVPNTDSVLFQSTLDDEFTEIYNNADSKSCGFYVHNLNTGVLSRVVNSNLSLSLDLNNYCVAPYVIIEGQEYRGDVVNYLI